MAENTARRGVYLPKELDDWFLGLASETNIKINQLMLDALNEYKSRHTPKGKKTSQFEKDVMAVLKKHGIK
jgi:hypothetical protein